MGNCCISSSNQQLSRRPKNGKGNLNGSEKHSPVSVTYLATGKTAHANTKKKNLVENGSSLRVGKNASAPAAKSGNPYLDHNNHDSKRLSLRSDVNDQNIEALFLKYKEKNEDCILAVGTEKLCQDLKLDPTEFRVLLLAWKFDVSQMCRFTKQEFFDGCKSLRVDSIPALQSKLAKVEKDVENKEYFRDLYRFTYGFGLDVEDGQRTLPIQVAVDLWKLVFTKSSPPFLEEWFEFLEDRQVKGISRDTWNMFLYLSETIKPDFSNYDESEAWPSLFDEFVAKRNEQKEPEDAN